MDTENIYHCQQIFHLALKHYFIYKTIKFFWLAEYLTESMEQCFRIWIHWLARKFSRP